MKRRRSPFQALPAEELEVMALPEARLLDFESWSRPDSGFQSAYPSACNAVRELCREVRRMQAELRLRTNERDSWIQAHGELSSALDAQELTLESLRQQIDGLKREREHTGEQLSRIAGALNGWANGGERSGQRAIEAMFDMGSALGEPF